MMPTTLMDLASRVFLLLASFRRKAARGAPMVGDQLHAEATKLFAELDQTAQREPALVQAWESARNALVYLVDEIMTGTEWEHRAWWDGHVLESSLLNNPQKMRGILFFDELDQAKRLFREGAGAVAVGVPADRRPAQRPAATCSSDLLSVLYCCLRFGFCGKFVGQTQELEREAREILDLLPDAGKQESRAYFEQAYRHTVEVPPSYRNVMRLGTMLAVIVALAILFVGFRTVLWNELLDDLAVAAARVGNFFSS